MYVVTTVVRPITNEANVDYHEARNMYLKHRSATDYGIKFVCVVSQKANGVCMYFQEGTTYCLQKYFTK